MWKIGDIGYIITNKKKSYVSAFEIVGIREDGFYMARFLNGKTVVATSARRIFRTPEDAITALDLK